jgi:hypothetical protein
MLSQLLHLRRFQKAKSLLNTHKPHPANIQFHGHRISLVILYIIYTSTQNERRIRRPCLFRLSARLFSEIAEKIVIIFGAGGLYQNLSTECGFGSYRSSIGR